MIPASIKNLFFFNFSGGNFEKYRNEKDIKKVVVHRYYFFRDGFLMLLLLSRARHWGNRVLHRRRTKKILHIINPGFLDLPL